MQEENYRREEVEPLYTGNLKLLDEPAVDEKEQRWLERLLEAVNAGDEKTAKRIAALIEKLRTNKGKKQNSDNLVKELDNINLTTSQRCHYYEKDCLRKEDGSIYPSVVYWLLDELRLNFLSYDELTTAEIANMILEEADLVRSKTLNGKDVSFSLRAIETIAGKWLTNNGYKCIRYPNFRIYRKRNLHFDPLDERIFHAETLFRWVYRDFRPSKDSYVDLGYGKLCEAQWFTKHLKDAGFLKKRRRINGAIAEVWIAPFDFDNDWSFLPKDPLAASKAYRKRNPIRKMLARRK